MLLLMAVFSVDSFSQRHLVVVDVETLIPVSGANVVSREGTSVTDSLGHVLVSDSCRSLSFSHVNYESRIINLAEVRDTVFIDLKKKLKMDAINAQLAAANPNSGINVLAILKKLIPKKWLASLRKNSKEERLKRLQKMLDEY